MKKPLIILLSLLSTSVFAQKNSILLDGTISYNSSVSKDTINGTQNMSALGLMPYIGYQVTDNWTFGIAGTYRTNFVKSSVSSVDYRTSGAGLFARYTIPVYNHLFFFTQGNILYDVKKSYTNGTYIPGTTENSLAVQIIPKIGLNIKRGYAMNFAMAHLGYTTGKNADAKSEFSTFNITSGYFQMGVSKNFISRKKNKATPENG